MIMLEIVFLLIAFHSTTLHCWYGVLTWPLSLASSDAVLSAGPQLANTTACDGEQKS